MSATEDAAIPFERQSDPQTTRTCGAACLTMVYHSFGLEVPQTQIWPLIAKQNRFGSLASTTHLMTRDALGRGFRAVAIQVRHPLQALQLCRNSGIRAILNQRLKHDAPTGHYTVLVDVDAEKVVLHDPFYGPSRCLSHAELLDLWQPRFPDSEIVGQVLIGISAERAGVPACQLCGTPFPSHVECPKCNQNVSLHPSVLLGCVNSACMARMWNYLCCPACDYMWTFSLGTPPAVISTSGSPQVSSRTGGPRPTSQGAAALSPSEIDLWKLSSCITELDRFCSHILSLPDVADHPEIKKQIDFMIASKTNLKLAQAEAAAHLTAHQEQLTGMINKAKEQEEAHRKKVEEINSQLPPLDGDALGRALLKNLDLEE